MSRGSPSAALFSPEDRTNMVEWRLATIILPFQTTLTAQEVSRSTAGKIVGGTFLISFRTSYLISSALPASVVEHRGINRDCIDRNFHVKEHLPHLQRRHNVLKTYRERFAAEKSLATFTCSCLTQGFQTSTTDHSSWLAVEQDESTDCNSHGCFLKGVLIGPYWSHWPLSSASLFAPCTATGVRRQIWSGFSFYSL